MPNPTLRPWKNVFQNLSLPDHSVVTEAAFWLPHFRHAKLEPMHEAIFGTEDSIRLTRERLLTHAYPTPEQKCLEILLWGYPYGGRGHLHINYLDRIDLIAEYAPLASSWAHYQGTLKPAGLGISTISKLAYFFGHSFGGFPALILDRRLINTLAGGRWSPLAMPGLTYANAAKRYLEYLALMQAQAFAVGCSPAQLELGLFLFGHAY